MRAGYICTGGKFNAQVGKWRVVSKVENETEADVGRRTGNEGKNSSDDRFKYFYCF